MASERTDQGAGDETAQNAPPPKKDPNALTPEEQRAYQQWLALPPDQQQAAFKGNLPDPKTIAGLEFEAKHGKQLTEALTAISDFGNDGVTTDSTTPGKPPKPPGPKPPGPNANAITPAAAAANQMMQGLAAQFAGTEAALAPYMGGGAGTAATNYATQLGQSIGGPAVQAQNQQYAAALAGPQSEVAKAGMAGAGQIEGALSNLGQADQAFMQTAPYQGLLSALQSEAQYRAETSGTVPISGTPQWIQDAYKAQQSAGSPSASAVGAGGSGAATPNPANAASSPSSNTSSSPGAAGGSG